MKLILDIILDIRKFFFYYNGLVYISFFLITY